MFVNECVIEQTFDQLCDVIDPWLPVAVLFSDKAIFTAKIRRVGMDVSIKKYAKFSKNYKQ